jgi:hypothetical protein
MTLLRRKRVIAAKIESNAGTAVALAGADGVFNAYDAEIQPTAEFIQRQGQGSAGQLAGVVGVPTGTMSFRTELYGNGAGTKPSWADVLFPACGFPVSSGNIFAPLTAAPGTAVKTVTIGVFEDGLFKSLRGAVGTFVLTAEPGKPVYFDWTFTGAWVTPTDASIIAPTYPTRLPIRARQGTTTVGTYALCYSSFTLDAGNVIAPRLCVNAIGGIHSMIITDRNITGTIDPESNLVANYPVYTDWINSTTKTLTVEFADADDKFIILSSGFQVTNAQEGDREGLQIDSIDYQLVKGNSPDSEITMEFDDA